MVFNKNKSGEEDMKLAIMFPILVLVSVTGYAQNTNTVVVTAKIGNDTPAGTIYSIGDTGPAGGIVFDVTDDGLHGLEAAPEDASTSIEWGCYGTDVADVDNIKTEATPDSNSGADNTSLIVAACGEETAAVAAFNHIWPDGTSGGFLPNKEELNLLSVQKAVVGGFPSDYYWSSSEYTSVGAWSQYFVFDSPYHVNKNDKSNGVRAIRAF